MRIRDRRARDDSAYFSAEALSRNMHRTNEGFLLCLGVPIARTGAQLYHAMDGLPVEPNSGGEVVVDRDEEEVFRPETIASFNGKPITLDHPMVDDPGEAGWDVHPGNVQEFEVGTVLNPRRGDGDNSDKILADLLIKRQDAIDAVLDGRREVSCGYDAQYEALTPGHARQRNIVGNHVALVDAARCGPACSIQDSEDGETRMTARTATAASGDRFSRFMDALRGAAVRHKDKALESHVEALAGELTRDELVGGAAGTEHHMHVHLPQTGDPPAAQDEDPMEQLTRRVDDMEKKFSDSVAKAVRDALRSAGVIRDADEEEENDEETRDAEIFPGEIELDDPEPEATGVSPGGLSSATPTPVARDRRTRRVGDGAPGPRVRARDSAHLELSFRDTIARAEMLLPGVRVPTFDSRRSAATTIDGMCQFRRNVLLGAWKTEDGREAISPVLGTTRDDIAPIVKRMTCDSVLALFNGSTELARRANNYAAPARAAVNARTGDGPRAPQSIAELNRANRKFWDPAR